MFLYSKFSSTASALSLTLSANSFAVSILIVRGDINKGAYLGLLAL